MNAKVWKLDMDVGAIPAGTTAEVFDSDPDNEYLVFCCPGDKDTAYTTTRQLAPGVASLCDTASEGD